MAFVQNFPFFCIMISLYSGIAVMIMGPKVSRWVSLLVITAVGVMSAVLLAFTVRTGISYTYSMGHFPAPFGNEIRVGPLEALLALLFSVVMLLSKTGGHSDAIADIPREKSNLFSVMLNLLFTSFLAIIYTNDLFTAYVFIEIGTIAACSIIMVKPGGKTLAATISYLIMALIGSGLVLFSISMLYSVTGHLLMEPIRDSVHLLNSSGDYRMPLFVVMGLMCVGLSIKSALYPFHSWLPDAHASATTSASSILSGLVVKCYALLLIKFLYRVIGLDLILSLRINDVLLVFGIVGLVMGSLLAASERNVKRLLAYSSVAQVGYIFIGIGIGTDAGLVAAIFHIFFHATAKPMLFTAVSGLSSVSGHKRDLASLRGSGRRAPLSGAAFVCGALSMIGIPLFSGFVSKFYLATSAMTTTFESVVIISVLVFSTFLNVLYYVPAIICIYAKPGEDEDTDMVKQQPSFSRNITLIIFIVINFALGMFSAPVIRVIEMGLSAFG